jgi:hypothetical protein
VVVGGGAIKGGQVVGATDKEGASVQSGEVRVGDLFATIYKAIGLDPAQKLYDNGRPLPLVEGTPIAQLV